MGGKVRRSEAKAKEKRMHEGKKKQKPPRTGSAREDAFVLA